MSWFCIFNVFILFERFFTSMVLDHGITVLWY